MKGFFMAASVRNQRRLRAFLTAVRTQHGLTRWDFAPLIGLNRSMYYMFDRKKKCLGPDSIKSMAQKLSWDKHVVAAMLDAKAPPVELPPPETVNLESVGTELGMMSEMLIDLETATRMIGAITAAGRALPLTDLLRLTH